MSESRSKRGFGVPLSAMAACAVLVVYVHGALAGCAKSGEGGIDGDGSSSGEEEESGPSGDSGDTGDSGDSGDFSSGSGDTDGTGSSGETTGSSSSGNPQTGPDCCVGGTTPGCADSNVEQCVCAADDYCCTTEWNDECVALVDELGCGSCGGTSSSSGSTSGGNPTDDCCMPSPSPGCSDPSIEQCVCQDDDYCCTTEWNDLCVDLVDQLGCGSCGGSSSSGSSSSSSGNPGGGECCLPSDQPGCVDTTVEQCVCSQDDYCCTTAWDDLCVSEVSDFGCGMCI